MVLGLYLFLMSVTGAILVYANEMYRAATREPVRSTGSGPRLTEEQLRAAALRLYPGYAVNRVGRHKDPDQAAEIEMVRAGSRLNRLFDVRTGADLGEMVPWGIKFVSGMIDLHDNLKAGPRGRSINGLGALSLLLLSLTGIFLWWPGSREWWRSLSMPRGAGSRRFFRWAHVLIGVVSLAFLIVFAASGVYLCNPVPLQDFNDWIDPPTLANAGNRLGDKILYWLAFLHFGRIQGIGIPCKGPGFCDQSTKAVWALFGFAPALLFLTGAMMWWNRVIRPRLRRASSEP